MGLKNIPRFLVFVHVQELTNPTVEAPGKGYIGEYTMKVSSVDLKQSTPGGFVLSPPPFPLFLL